MASNPNDNVMMQMMLSGMYGPNKYSAYQDTPMPMPGYAGTPTDAMGNPIQPAPGTTLNTTPPPAPPPQQAAPAQPTLPQYQPSMQETRFGQQPAWDKQTADLYDAVRQLQAQGGQSGQSGQSGFGQTPNAAAAAPPSSSQNALSLLANPGKVTTPGATVPQAPALSQQPSVLQHFLATQQGGQGAGNYSNKGFFSTLNALRGGS